MNKYLNKLLKTEGEDYVLACDTDSMYITLDHLVRECGLEGSQVSEVVKFLDKICTEKFEPFIDRSYEHLSRYVNAYAQKMKMKREAIADKGIWTAKKHYILNVWDNEGVSYTEPKLKMMGIEAVRSSTPASCRQNIKDCLQVIMTKDEDATIEFIENFRREFSKMEFEQVAFPRGVKNLREYMDLNTIYRKATPIHVRGALLYNDLLKKKKLDVRYQKINDGDKIKFCYLKLPNPLRENVIACSGSLPKQLELDQFIDYDLQFEKAFLEPIKTILDVIGWRTEKRGSLESFFG